MADPRYSNGRYVGWGYKQRARNKRINDALKTGYLRPNGWRIVKDESSIDKFIVKLRDSDEGHSDIFEIEADNGNKAWCYVSLSRNQVIVTVSFSETVWTYEGSFKVMTDDVLKMLEKGE